MEKINITELLKDCPKGMELDCTLFNKVQFEKCTGDAIYIRLDGRGLFGLDKYGSCFEFPDSKCVIFPKGKTTWEGFHRPFVNGDVIVDKTGAIAIYRQIHNSYEKPIIDFHCRITSKNNWFFHINGIGSLSHCWEIDSARFATEKEKQKLFQAIKDNGYKWNPDTKTLEKLQKFKDGDILAYDNTSLPSTVFIYRNYNPDWNTGYFVALSGRTGKFYKDASGALDSYNPNVRFATEEEKEKLFETIEKNGYKLNAKKKCLEKLIKPKFKIGDKITNDKIFIVIGYIDDEYYYEIGRNIANRVYIKNQDEWKLVPNKFDINILKHFDKVLVRNCNTDKWDIDFFGYYFKGYYYTTGSRSYKQCIPYKGNEHITGTSVDCAYFYKNWEE